jgi:predicted permease
VLREIGQDLTYAVRLLRRSPGVVAVTVLGLGLAIGVSTAVFSLLNAALFRPTGIDDPASAVRVMRVYRNGLGNAWRYADYLHLHDGARSVRLEASLRGAASISTRPGTDVADTASLLFVSGGYLSALSNRTFLGRALTAADDVQGAPPVAVVSYVSWSRRLGAATTSIGQPIWLNGTPFTVVGVSPRGFSGTADTPPEVWVPLAHYHTVHGGPPLDRLSSTTVDIIARVTNGYSNAQAEAELSAVAVSSAVGRREPEAGVESSAARQGESDQARAPVEEILTGVRFDPITGVGGKNASAAALIVVIVMTAIGLVLLLACVNVANLLLASAISRQREIGVRLALGASRGRIGRQLLTESLSLGLVSGASGLLFTIWLVPLLAAMAPAPASVDLAPDMRVYLFLGLVSVVAGFGAGLAPARHAIRDNLMSPLKGVGARAEGVTRPVRLRTAFVGVQAGASLVLLVLAALLARGMVRASHVDIGFDGGRLLTLEPAFGRGTYDTAGAKAYWELALERVRALPGVQSASLAEYPPFGDANRATILRRADNRYTIYHNDTRAEYFATLGLRAVRGRTYTAAEVEGRAPVAVISETLARDFFPGEDPIGQSLGRILENSRATIIGVVSNAITARLRELGSAALYQPMDQTLAAKMVIRTAGVPGVLIPSVRSAVHSIDPRVRLSITPVSERLQQQLAEPRTLASLAGLLAAVALVLAVVGVYGVTAFVVGQRTQEISVRIALGASGRDITRLLLHDSLRPVTVGLAAGLFVALLGGRVLAGVLYGVSTVDPIAFVAALLVLLSAATLAVIVPTRGAATADPAAVLRQ